MGKGCLLTDSMKNKVECTNTEYIQSNHTLETIKISSSIACRQLCLENYRGLKYTLYMSRNAFKRDEQLISFETDRESEVFLQNLNLMKWW